ncbi:MAG: hypothetical protein COA30_04960 [Sulfurimonas sp.]|nr:MAG: hypothetical protein COA30_04960 [Sulfurimonas sp.]
MYPIYTKKELSVIGKKNYITKNRILDYKNSLKKMQNKSDTYKLQRTNFYFNQYLPEYDQVMQKEEDFWSTPKEFLRSGYGDCEDYVIIKYFSLLTLGFDEHKLFLTVVKEKFQGSSHMVLSYFEQENQSPKILDNLSIKVLSLEKRVDLEPVCFINSTGVYKLSAEYKLRKIADSYKKFNLLLKKIEKNL